MIDTQIINYIDLAAAQILFQKMAEEALDEAKWNSNYIRVSKFVQDKYEYIDKDNPENNHEPTFNWYCCLTSQRLDEQFFQVEIRELKEEIIDGKISEALAIEDFENAIESLKDFSDCNCGTNKACENIYH